MLLEFNPASYECQYRSGLFCGLEPATDSLIPIKRWLIEACKVTRSVLKRPLLHFSNYRLFLQILIPYTSVLKRYL